MQTNMIIESSLLYDIEAVVIIHDQPIEATGFYDKPVIAYSLLLKLIRNW